MLCCSNPEGSNSFHSGPACGTHPGGDKDPAMLGAARGGFCPKECHQNKPGRGRGKGSILAPAVRNPSPCLHYKMNLLPPTSPYLDYDPIGLAKRARPALRSDFEARLPVEDDQEEPSRQHGQEVAQDDLPCSALVPADFLESKRGGQRSPVSSTDLPTHERSLRAEHPRLHGPGSAPADVYGGIGANPVSAWCSSLTGKEDLDPSYACLPVHR